MNTPTPSFHIQPGTLEAIPGLAVVPVAEWPWTWIVIIVVVVICAVLIISWTTQRSISSMASTARQMMAEARSEPRGKRQVSGITAFGRAELEWQAGAFKLGLRSRFPGDEASVESAYRNADRLAQVLFGQGITDAQIAQSEVQTEVDGTASLNMVVSLFIEAEARCTKVLEAAMAAGFSEVRDDGREEISMQDAAEVAARLAIEDAMANTSVLLDHLEIDKAGLKVISARIGTEPGNGKIVRVAEVVWDGDH